WQERALNAVVIGAVVVLVLLGFAPGVRAGSWLWYVWLSYATALLVGIVALTRLGWLKLFGPVLFYDMVRTSRRGRYFLVRCLYLLTGLPILSFLQCLGGIDPDLVLASFAATGVTAFGIACISVLHSVVYKRPRDAIAMTYVFLLAYLAIATTLFGFMKARY